MTQPTKKADTAPSATGDKAEAKSTSTTKTDSPGAQTDFARLGVNSDVSDFVEYGGYREPDSEDWVPNPHFQYGTLDTTDTAGAAHQNIREISPVFDLGRAQALAAGQQCRDGQQNRQRPDGVEEGAGQVCRHGRCLLRMDWGLRRA